MKVRERDLRLDSDPVRFGNAIVRCEGYSPDCMYNGRCSRKGECFASPPHLVAARMIEDIIPNDGRGGRHIAYLRLAAEGLRNGRIDF